MGIKVSFKDFMENKSELKNGLNKKLQFSLDRIQALKIVRELHDLAKNRVDFHTREHAYTILRLNKQEKDEYLYLVDIYFNSEKIPNSTLAGG